MNPDPLENRRDMEMRAEAGRSDMRQIAVLAELRALREALPPTTKPPPESEGS